MVAYRNPDHEAWKTKTERPHSPIDLSEAKEKTSNVFTLFVIMGALTLGAMIIPALAALVGLLLFSVFGLAILSFIAFIIGQIFKRHHDS